MAANVEDKKGRLSEAEIWNDIKGKAARIGYGSISIIIHDGKIVQVETSTKTRY